MPTESSKRWKAIGIIAFIVVMVAVVSGLTPWLMAQALLLSAKDKLVEAGMPDILASGLMWLLGIPFVLALFRALNPLPWAKGWPKSRPIAMGIVATYVGAFFVALYAIGGQPPTGRYYCPVGCIHYFKEDAQCPRHLVQLQEVTAQALVNARRHGCKGPQRVEGLGPDGPFRDITTNAILIYFGHDHSNRLVPYDGPGFDPVMGGELTAAGRDMVIAWQRQCAEDDKASADTVAIAGSNEAAGGSDPSSGPKTPGVRQPVKQGVAPIRHPEWDGMSIGELINLVAMEPDNSRLHFYIGQRLEFESDSEGALRSYKAARRANPNHAEAQQAIERLEPRP